MTAPNAHRWPLRVYFEDTDAGGIVYHARFLAFAERGRTEALRALGAPHQDLVDQLGLLFVVRRVKVDYLAPARLDESLSVVTTVNELRGATATLDQVIEGADGTVKARLEVMLVCVRMADNRPARVPERWMRALTEIGKTRPGALYLDQAGDRDPQLGPGAEPRPCLPP
jgi:acyl-CoA thioester hydrolase